MLAACRNYLSKLPPAVSGQGGHAATLRVACECVRFGLGDADAMALLREYSARCLPPFSEKELVHKLDSARRKAGSQQRSAARPAPAVRVAWRLERKTPQPLKCVTLPPPTPAAASSPRRRPLNLPSDFFSTWPA